MLAFAGMDAISKWLVADYPVGQMMWIRYGVFCRLRLADGAAARRLCDARCAARRPWLQGGRALLALVESASSCWRSATCRWPTRTRSAATSPLIVIALGVLFLGERADLERWLAVLAGFAGMLLIVRPGLPGVRLRRCCCRCWAPCMWAVYQILTRLCARSDSTDTTLVWSAFVALRGDQRGRAARLAMAVGVGLGADVRRRACWARSPSTR